jgi:hypothetical protein
VRSQKSHERAGRIDRWIHASHFGIAAVLGLICLAAPAAEPVTVILYGRSEEIQRHLKELPSSVAYQQIAYRVSGEKRGRKLLVGVSGGVSSTQVSPLLDAVRIQYWWKFQSDPWRLFVHGDLRYARITLASAIEGACNQPMIWYAFNDSGNWVVFDGPGTPSDVPEICDIVVPPPQITTYE